MASANGEYLLLRRLAAFDELDDDLLDRIAARAETESVPEGTILFSRGETPRALYVLLEGQVALSSTAGNGASTVIEVLQPVDVFVLASVLLDAPYLMSATTIDPCRLLCIPAAELRRTIAGEPRLAMAMMASLSSHYRMLVRQVADLKLRSAAQRLGCYLLALAETQPESNRVSLSFDKKLLASRLGTRPEHLSRAFATLREYGVSTRGSTVVLRDPDKLAAFAAPDDLPGPP